MTAHESLPLCQCGCGQSVTRPENHFINTHAQRQLTSESLFWKHIQKTETCWLWTGAQINMHYGLLTFKQRNYLAHRFSWILHYGPIPQGLQVLHDCDHPLCCRPNHLFLGTQADNMADMARKGRHWMRQPSNMYRLKLNAEAIKVICFLKGQKTQKALAKAYKVHQSHICKIQSRKRWTSLSRI